MEIADLQIEKKRADDYAGKIEALHAEIGSISSHLTAKDEQLRGKALEVQILNSELLRMNDAKNGQEFSGSEKEEFQLKIAAMTTEIVTKSRELSYKEEENDKLKMELANMSMAQSKVEMSSDKPRVLDGSLRQLENAIAEQRKVSNEVKNRLEKSREKMMVLNNKTRGGIESIAAFAGSKEFEEVKRSDYMDNLTHRYEQEIKDLKMQVEMMKLK